VCKGFVHVHALNPNPQTRSSLFTRHSLLITNFDIPKLIPTFAPLFLFGRVLKIENQYIIHFKGLKEGVHDFSFAIGKPFFEAHPRLEIPDGSVSVSVQLVKKNNFMELFIRLSGELQVQCDRCLEYFPLPLMFDGHLVVRFSETEKEPDDEVIFLHPEESQLGLAHYLYECISLSLPMRKVHPDEPGGNPGCDPEMLKRLNDMLIEE
jgi:hypothetical protein